MWSRLACVCGLGLVGAACIDRAPFPCERDEQCEGAGQQGYCVAPGYCAHPDSTCDSDLRFGRFAAEPLAGTCTPPDPGSSEGGSVGGEGSGSSGSSETGGGSEAGPSSSGAPVPVEECDGLDNDADGLTDEWSVLNEECGGCTLFQREGRAYWLCSNGRWTDVQQVCEGFGANLASVQDPEENLFLALKLDGGAYWIGINDIGNEGVYTWVDGEPVDYTNWADGSPPADNLDSNCGGIDTQGEWLVLPCNNSRQGFCEAAHPEGG